MLPHAPPVPAAAASLRYVARTRNEDANVHCSVRPVVEVAGQEVAGDLTAFGAKKEPGIMAHGTHGTHGQEPWSAWQAMQPGIVTHAMGQCAVLHMLPALDGSLRPWKAFPVTHKRHTAGVF